MNMQIPPISSPVLMDGLQTQVQVIGPEDAKTLLANNFTGNRPQKKRYWTEYARRMSEGQWRLSPQPIVITRDGTLLDGQHRMLAIVLTGKSFKFNVAVVQDTSSYEVLDQGLGRTNADILNLPSTIVGPIQFLLRAVDNITKPSPSDVRQLVQSELGTLLQTIDTQIKPKHRVFKHNSFRTAFAMSVLTEKSGYHSAYAAYRSVCNEPMDQWPPIMVDLFQKLLDPTKYKDRSGSRLSNDVFILTYYAFSNLRNRDKVKRTKAFLLEANVDVTRTINGLREY